MAKPSPDKLVTIRFTKRAYDKTQAALFKDEKEAVCFLFANTRETRERIILLVDYVVTLDESCYVKRTRTNAVVKARCKNKVYRRFVESTYTGLINCHSHPFAVSSVAFSPIDDADDLRELCWQYDQLPRGKRSCRNRTKIHCLSMVFGKNCLAARGYRHTTPPSLPAIEQVHVQGEKLHLFDPTGRPNTIYLSPQIRETYDRQIMAFGIEGQKALAQLRIVLVGCGGIGSILAEGLLRLGVLNLTLIDHDLLDKSNLNRWQGGRPKDVGKPKAHVLARRLRSMNPNIKVSSIAFPLTHPKALRAIKNADILIGAVDNHQARFLMNRISSQYLIPYLDAGTVIHKAEGEDNQSLNQMQLWFRLGVFVPGITACMQCSQIKYFDFKEIAFHLYDPQTQAQLKASGYIKDHPEIQAASVMPLNMLAAGALLTELLNLVTAFHPLARNVAMDWLHPNGRTIRADSENFPEGPAKDCLNCTALLGTGDSEPLPHIHMPATTEQQAANDLPLAANE